VWEARSYRDCVQDAESVRIELIKSFKARLQTSCHPAWNKLSKCLDMHSIFKLLVSNDDSAGSVAYDQVGLYLYGVEEFKELVDYVGSLETIKETRLNFNYILAPQMMEKIKSALSSIIWGELFSTVGVKIFQVVEGPLKGKFLSELDGDPSVQKFSISESPTFILECNFLMKLTTTESSLKVKLVEPEI